MRNLLKLLLVFFLMFIYIYVLVINNLPDNIVVFEGEKISIKKVFGLEINENKTVETVSNNSKEIIGKKKSLNVSLFDKIKLKDINVDVLPKTKVIPVGSIAGIKLYTSGILVVGMSEIEGKDNKKYKPYENSGIEEGDRITKINEKEVVNTKELIETVNNSKGNNINIDYIHDEKVKSCSITPVETSNNEYKLGLWVRDSAARGGNSYIL